MSNTEKSAGIFGGPSVNKEQLLQQFYGDRLLSSAGAGAGLGLGATALYHLLRGAKAKGKKERKYPGYGSGTPMIAKEAFAPPPMGPPPGAMTTVMLPRPPISTTTGMPGKGHIPGFSDVLNQVGRFNKTLMSTNSVAPQQQTNPGINGGLTNAPQRPFGFANGMPNNGAGGFNPLLMKNSFDLGSLSQTVGSALPKTMIPFGAPHVGGAAPSADPHPWRKSWSTAANIGGAAAGAYAGSKLVNAIMKAKKRRDNERALEAARDEYYAALGGKRASALDGAFETVKQANILSSTASAVWNTPQTLRTAYLLTLLGAGGLGAKYMYDRTKDLTEGENLARAQASRARTRGLPPVWVDPDALANVKSTVQSDE